MERQTLQKTQTARAQSNRLQTKAGDATSGRNLLGLQSSVGNQAVQRLINSPIIQAKLNAGSPIIQRKCDLCEGDECAKCASTTMNGPLEEEQRKAEQEPMANQPLPGSEASAPPTPPITSGENPVIPSETSGGENARLLNVPAASYILPYDHSPLAAAGERVIFGAMFTDPTPGDYRLEYSTTGGHFDSATGPTTKNIPGLVAGNVDFFVPTGWTGTSTLQVVMRLRRISTNSIIQTETWNFGLKSRYPTTMTQVETTGERTMPADYTYNIGPRLRTGSAPFYQHQTILERFGSWSLANIVPADINGAYRTQHSLNSTAAITSHFLGPTNTGLNGTFTVDAADQIGDRHDGTLNVSNLVSNLVAPKDIEIALPQVYEARPGTTLGSYTVTRVRKANGTWRVKKG